MAQSPPAATAAETMRILLLHNRYRQPGGEERAVGDLARLLKRAGHEVSVLERFSEQAGRTGATRGLLRGGVASEEVARAVQTGGIEVVHAHNLHPLFGWRALAAARAAGARTVVHLHNYRLFCAIAVGYRDGGRCSRCRGRHTLPGVTLRCRGSVGEAAVYAAGLSRQQLPIFAHTDCFVAVSHAALERLRFLGLPPQQPAVALPNCLTAERFATGSRAQDGTYALAAGRLVPEKGFDTAIIAARRADVPLMVVGDGPDRHRLQALAGAGAGVRFTGQLPEAELAALRAGAGAVLVPSRWEEPCPYAVLDALATGVPVLASNRGGLPELVGDGVVLAPEDPEPWARELRRLFSDPSARRREGDRGLERARRHHAAGPYLERLLAVYRGR